MYITAGQLVARIVTLCPNMNEELHIKDGRLLDSYGTTLMDSGLVTVKYHNVITTGDNSNYLPAIRDVREFTRCGLMEARALIDALRNGAESVTITGYPEYLDALNNHGGSYIPINGGS